MTAIGRRLSCDFGQAVEPGEQGELQTALLKLEELDRNLQGEPYGSLLLGDLLFRKGLSIGL